VLRVICGYLYSDFLTFKAYPYSSENSMRTDYKILVMNNIGIYLTFYSSRTFSFRTSQQRDHHVCPSSDFLT